MSQKGEDHSVYSCAALRYLVDAGREVTVPAGVILWSPDRGEIWFRLPREGERIPRVPLPAARADLELVQSQIEGWHRRGQLPYATEPDPPLSLAWWDQVRRLLQWSVRLGPVHALDCDNPEAELEVLYERTVQPDYAGCDRPERVEAAVEEALGASLSARLDCGHTVPGFLGRPVPVLRFAADDRHAVVVEAVDLIGAGAEQDADVLASRLACIRNGERGGQVRFVLGYLAPARAPEETERLKAWISHEAGVPLFDLEEEAEAFRAAAAAALAALEGPMEDRHRARLTVVC